MASRPGRHRRSVTPVPASATATDRELEDLLADIGVASPRHQAESPNFAIPHWVESKGAVSSAHKPSWSRAAAQKAETKLKQAKETKLKQRWDSRTPSPRNPSPRTPQLSARSNGSSRSRRPRRVRCTIRAPRRPAHARWSAPALLAAVDARPLMPAPPRTPPLVSGTLGGPLSVLQSCEGCSSSAP